MPLVSKCCCCCNLKYGYFTYGILCMMGRVCALTALYFVAPSIYLSSARSESYHYGPSLEQVLTTYGTFVGWFIATSIALFIALKGIMQERSILMYPYIVIMFLEITTMIILSIILSALVTPWFLVNLVVGGGINIYALICLISLYQHIKNGEKQRPAMFDNVALKTV